MTAARAAGADAADAVAVRSISLSVQVREGAVEESERAEGDDIGLRVFVGARQAVVSTNDIKADVGRTCRARGRDGAGRARRSVCGPRRSERAGADISGSRPARSRPAVGRRTGAARQGCRSGRARGRGRDQVGRRIGVGRSRRHGAGDQPGLQRRLSQFRPRPVDGSDRGRRHHDGARLRLSPARCMRADLESAGEGRPHRRRARGEAAQSAQGRDQARPDRVRPADLGLAGRPSGQRDQRQRGRAQDQFPAGEDGRAAVQAGHPHHRRSAAQARPALAAVRCRRRRGAAAGGDRRRRSDLVVSRQRDRA